MVIGQWHPSNVDEPNVGYAYGARPIVDTTPAQETSIFSCFGDNVWITGIDAYPSNTDPGSVNWDGTAYYGNEVGISSGQDQPNQLGAEDCRVQFGGGDGMFTEHQRNVTAPGIAVLSQYHSPRLGQRRSRLGRWQLQRLARI